jgi:hypothetical protein
MRHFETVTQADGATATRPRMVSVPLPAPDGTWRTREVPEVALMHHHALQIEEVCLKFRVTMFEGDVSGVMVELSRPADPSTALWSHAEPGRAAQAPAPGSAEMEILFRRGDKPEGIARVSGEYHKTL